VGDDATGPLKPVGEAPFARAAGGWFVVGLAEPALDVLRQLCAGLRELLLTGHAAGDPAVARLFPAAYDDPLRNLDYERVTGDELLASRLAGLDTMEATLDADRLTEAELLAWLRTVNDLRLVLGTRLEVTEETGFADFADDEDAAADFQVYAALAGLQSWMLDALEPGIDEVESAARDPAGPE